ncbi:MAG: hypothetical protein A6F70_10405 [Cycloclasticus sp. symbiont of Bathymodiolus heckerae]|nr:MAG: hypothetical protein A6F70_10405 [Cycloclasticus sp. symbiont of Bathymodiolus heckerae]
MPMPEFPVGAVLYILDFCYPMEQLISAAQKARKIVVLDHHISAQKAFETYQGVIPANLGMHFNMQQSGCMLTWHYFQGDIAAPMILRHIEDHDLWRHQIKHTEEIVKALFLYRPISFAKFEQLQLDTMPIRLSPKTSISCIILQVLSYVCAALWSIGRKRDFLSIILGSNRIGMLDTLYREGKILLKQHRQMVKALLNSRHSIKLGDTLGLAVNAPGAFASELGQALAKLSGAFGLTYSFSDK